MFSREGKSCAIRCFLIFMVQHFSHEARDYDFNFSFPGEAPKEAIFPPYWLG